MKTPDDFSSRSDSGRTGRLHRSLVAAARTEAADERVPQGFERRVLRAIGPADLKRGAGASEDWTVFWVRGLWRALIPAMSCLVVAGALQLHRRGAAEAEGSAFNGLSAVERETEEWGPSGRFGGGPGRSRAMIIPFKVGLVAVLLFGTGVATGVVVSRLGPAGELGSNAQNSAANPPPRGTTSPGSGGMFGTVGGEIPGSISVERGDRSVRSNVLRNAGIRPPGMSRLELFKRMLGELDLTAEQRARAESHVREAQEHLPKLLKPLQPEAARELKELRLRLVEDLTPEQRAKFERLLAERASSRGKVLVR